MVRRRSQRARKEERCQDGPGGRWSADGREGGEWVAGEGGCCLVCGWERGGVVFGLGLGLVDGGREKREHGRWETGDGILYMGEEGKEDDVVNRRT